MMRFQLVSEREGLSVDIRLGRINRRWHASAGSQDGPTLGYGFDALAAVYLALDPRDRRTARLAANLAALREHMPGGR